MKKFLISAITIMIFLASGCSQTQPKGTNTVTFASWGSQSETTVIKGLIKEFEEKNPQIKIQFIHIPQNYFQKLHLLFASNLAPDVAFINNIYAPIYIKAGLLEDLTPFFKTQITGKTFFDTSINSFRYDDKLYAIPRDISNLVIYYNKDIFKENNVHYPNENWDLNDFLKTAKQVKNEDNFSINFEEKSLYWLYYLEANGGGILSDDSNSIILDSKKSIESLQFYSDLANKYKVAPTKSQTASMTPAQMFINGKLAMYLGGRWMVPKFRETVAFDWDVVNFPISEGNKVLIDSSGWAISKNSKNKEQAAKFIEFLSSKESIEKLTQSGLIIPARADIATSQTFLAPDKKPKNSKIFIKMIKNAKPTPTNEHYQQINDILDEELESVFNGEKNADEVITSRLIFKLKSLL